MSNTLSIRPEAFSKDIEYEKPEQPPPTTPTRNPAGTGVCCAMISLTLAMAFGVSEMGAFFLASRGISWGLICGVVVVAMNSPLLLTHYNRRSLGDVRFKR